MCDDGAVAMPCAVSTADVCDAIISSLNSSESRELVAMLIDEKAELQLKYRIVTEVSNVRDCNLDFFASAVEGVRLT